MRLAKYILFTTLITALLLGGGAQAQEQDRVRITVSPTLQSRYVPGQATLLRILLENSGPDMEGQVEVEIQTGLGNTAKIYRVPLSLPHQARKQVSVVVGPLTDQARTGIKVRFVTGKEVRAETDLILMALQENAFVTGLMVVDPTPFSFLSGIKPGTQVLQMTPTDLPEQIWPLRNLDLIILAGVDTSGLSGAQRQALAQWVGLGGHLVVAGGPGAGLTMAGLPEEILPISLEGESTLDSLSDLEQLIGEQIPPSGPYLVSRASVHSGTILAAQGDIPLIVNHVHGLGQVTFLALDPTLAPLRSWAGNEGLWKLLLSADPRPNPWRRQMTQQSYSFAWALAQSIELQMPSMWAVGGLLLLYIVLVGPINYLILRRRRQLEWAWVTIPVLTVIFALSVYGLGHLTRGGEHSLSTISIVRMADGGPVAIVDSYSGLFSPRRQDYDISAGPNSLFGPLPSGWPGGPQQGGGRPLEILQAESPILSNFAVEQWSMRTFATRAVLDPAPNILVEVDIQGNRISGSFYNGTGTDLEGCMVLRGRSYASLGPLAAGEQRSQTLTLQESWGHLPIAAGTVEREIAQVLFGYNFDENLPGNLSLLCWTQDSPLPLALHEVPVEQQQQHTFYFIALQVPTIAPRTALLTGEIPAPPWNMVLTQGDFLTCTGGFEPGKWDIVLEYSLSTTITRSLRAMTLTLDGSDWSPLPKIQLYAWGRDWESMQPPSRTVVLNREQIDSYVNEGRGILRVRLISQSQSGSCLRPVLELYGGTP